MINIEKGQEKNISLKIRTFIVDPTEFDSIDEEIVNLLERIIEDDISSMAELEDMLSDEGREEFELCTEAVIRINPEGLCEIEYPENEDDDEMHSISKIIFNPSSPELVSITKEGAVRTYLSFEEGRTHICTYDTPFMPFKIYVESRTVDNRLLTDGHLHLNYVLNFADNPPRHFILDVDVLDA